MTDWRQSPSSGNDEVFTSPELWRPLARAVGGFDLDPAASPTTSIASTNYTKSDDGLSREWFGKVWLNPPFSEKEAWYRRLIDQLAQGNVQRAVVIAPNDMSADWAQRWFSRADLLGFLDGRDHYTTVEGSPSFGTVVGVWNHTPEVVEVLERKGFVR